MAGNFQRVLRRPSSKGQGTWLRTTEWGFESSWARVREGAISSAVERPVHTRQAGGSTPPLPTVAEPRSEERGCDPRRRGGGTLQSPQGELFIGETSWL